MDKLLQAYLINPINAQFKTVVTLLMEKTPIYRNSKRRNYLIKVGKGFGYLSQPGTGMNFPFRLSSELKNQISHRGRQLQQLLKKRE
jgi:inosine/xanthosine triphosphate pyrophosphatase family protein